ncbi:MAG: hypothetical protein F9B45_14025 [Phycisphaera sp. RhM]|nr:hypothetical protein [Phycisphaera sp. RhM]
MSGSATDLQIGANAEHFASGGSDTLSDFAIERRTIGQTIDDLIDQCGGTLLVGDAVSRAIAGIFYSISSRRRA